MPSISFDDQQAQGVVVERSDGSTSTLRRPPHSRTLDDVSPADARIIHNAQSGVVNVYTKSFNIPASWIADKPRR